MNDRRHDNNDNQDGHGHASSGMGRRKFIAASAAGTAAAWAVPQIVSMQAAAAGTRFTPRFITSATAYHQRGSLFAYTRTITLTVNGVQAGDLWLGVVAYDSRAGATLTIPGTLSLLGNVFHDAGTAVWPANNSVYSVRGRLLGRVLQAGDAPGGVFSVTINTPGTQAIDYGGLRGAAVVYRDDRWGLMSLPSGSNIVSNHGFGPVGAGDIVTTTFPQITPAPVYRNVVLSIGVARGYGGWYGLDPANAWTGGPGINRVNYNAGNLGDRAIWISERWDSDGSATSGTWYKQRNGNPPRTENWVSFAVGVNS